jgi:hypothetical protein
MSMPYRDEQILTILGAAPDGLTVAQILERAKKMPGNEIPDDKTIWNRLYALRNTKEPKVSRTDEVGGIIHKITQAGRKALESQTEKPQGQANTLIHPSPLSMAFAEILETPILPVDEPVIPNATDTLLASFDESIGIIRECIVAVMNNPEPRLKIRDKGRKIAALEQLEKVPFFTQDVVDILIAIRADIEQIEAE